MRYGYRLVLFLFLSITTCTSAFAQQQGFGRSIGNAAGRFVAQTVNSATARGARQSAQNSSLPKASTGSTSGVAMLPNVSTGSVDINTCDMDFIGGKSRPSVGDGGGGGGGSNGGSDNSGGVDTSGYPPSPGPGYQPMTQHGQFVGWYSPDEVALSQTDFPAALVSILKSDRYYGGIEGAASILYEIGDISSPFAFDEAAAFLGK